MKCPTCKGQGVTCKCGSTVEKDWSLKNYGKHVCKTCNEIDNTVNCTSCEGKGIIQVKEIDEKNI